MTIILTGQQPRLITNNTYIRSFQYKIFNNVLFLNKKLHTFGIKPSPKCSFCNLFDGAPIICFMNVIVLNADVLI